jgi:hypothetical protein
MRYQWCLDQDENRVVGQMIEAEEMRKSLNCINLNQNDFKELIAMKCFVYRNDCHDNIGRPLMFFVLKNLKLKDVSIDHL